MRAQPTWSYTLRTFPHSDSDAIDASGAVTIVTAASTRDLLIDQEDRRVPTVFQDASGQQRLLSADLFINPAIATVRTARALASKRRKGNLRPGRAHLQSSRLDGSLEHTNEMAAHDFGSSSSSGDDAPQRSSRSGGPQTRSQARAAAAASGQPASPAPGQSTSSASGQLSSSLTRQRALMQALSAKILGQEQGCPLLELGVEALVNGKARSDDCWAAARKAADLVVASNDAQVVRHPVNGDRTGTLTAAVSLGGTVRFLA
ncbi:unnamed protein product [Parajaminaea phylloscopi]